MLIKLAVVVISCAIAWIWMSPAEPIRRTDDMLQMEYDYVIVGAGTAGSILAVRLSEDPDVTVALLETGSTIGGESGMNDVMAIRGSPYDYDHWVGMMGNKGWSYEDVLPYFKKLETVHHKKSTETDATSAFLDAAEDLGFKIVDHDVEEITNKVMKVQAADGAQQSTAEAYLKPVASRPNLHVKTNAQAITVMFRGKRAVAVSYMNIQMKKVKARKEVILSAGTIGSAQILLLSGVGPKEDLKKIGIPVIADLPVGKNMRDNVHVPAAIVTLKKPAVPEQLGLLEKLKDNLFGTGANGHAGPVAATAFSRSNYQPANHHSPYLQYVLLNNMMNAEGHRNNINLKPEVHEVLYGGSDGNNELKLLLALQQPASVGYVRLDTTNSFDPPLINPNYLAEDVDVDVLLDGIRYARKIMSSGALVKKLGAKLDEHVHPDCANETYDSDEYWKCYIRRNTLNFAHPVSTCRMGPIYDKNSVVDPKLRVHGLQGLRVVDASVMPLITSGNTNLPVMMIAERTADIIKGKVSFP